MIDLPSLGYRYRSVDDAVHGLLGEAVDVLNGVGESFVVIGGWSPVLLAHGDIRHPGTRDVDVLFNGGEARLQLEQAFRGFLDRHYLPSAKHPFQVIRLLNVAGQPMAFNVDLLHPRHDENDAPQDDLFVDQLDLGVPVGDFLKDSYFMKSIVTPDIGFVFDDQRWVLAECESTLPDGTSRSLEVPVLDELGLIISKARSVLSPKRERDAFDIALSVTQARDADALRSAALELEDRRSGTFSLLGNIWTTVHDEQTTPSFHERVRRSILPDQDSAAADRLVEDLRQFLTDVDVRPHTAEN